MERNMYFVGIAFFGMVNGLFNHVALLFALIHMQVLAPALLFGSTSLTLMFSSLMVSTATIILGGIPAAIYERYVGATGRFDHGFALDMAGGDRLADPIVDGSFSQHRAVSGLARHQAFVIDSQPA